MLNLIAFIIKLVEKISVKPAGRLTFFLATWPRKNSIKERDRQNLSKATRIEIRSDRKIIAWSWGKGPLVILVHGWEGHSGQMAAIGMQLAENGFQSVAVDVRAHGESQGKRAGFFDFPQDAASVIKHLNKPVYACIGHSAGGLLLMAGRAKGIIQAEHYITIASPRGPYPPLDMVRKSLKVSDKIIDHCREAISEQFSCQWPDLIQGEMYEYQNQGKLMLIYDESDEIVKHTDSKIILNQWPDAHLLKTRGLTHYRLLWSQEVIENISAFLMSDIINTEEKSSLQECCN